LPREAAITPATSTEKDISFRWTFIIFPAAILLVSIVLAAAFYTRLPDQLAYQFSEGTPDGWVGRSAFIAWTLIPQAALAIIAFAIAMTVIFVARRWSFESPLLGKLLPVMGNMLALPQVIILFAMLEVFLYNSYQIKLISVWAFALAVVVLGGIALGFLLFRSAGQAHRLYGDSRRE
jgi:hypothetical protein